MGPTLAELTASTPLSGGNAAYVESIYERYLEDREVAALRGGDSTKRQTGRAAR